MAATEDERKREETIQEIREGMEDEGQGRLQPLQQAIDEVRRHLGLSKSSNRPPYK